MEVENTVQTFVLMGDGRRWLSLSLLPQGRHAAIPEQTRDVNPWRAGDEKLTDESQNTGVPNKAGPGVGINWKEASSRSSGSGSAGFDVWGCQHEILMAAR